MKRYEVTAAQGIHRGLRQTPHMVNNKTLFDPAVSQGFTNRFPCFNCFQLFSISKRLQFAA
jgi:hypothetical protein